MLAALTLLVLVADLAGLGSDAVRTAGATALGPLERLAGPHADARLAAVTAERDRLAVELRRQQAGEAAAKQLAALLGAPSTATARLVPARVVAVGPQGAAGPGRVTLDVGSRDGVRTDLSVVAAQGLVGRVVAVAPWTCDVLVLGSTSLTVGVRVGPSGVLGAVSGATAPGTAQAEPGSRGSPGSPGAPRLLGLLGLRLVQRGAVHPGDAVTTLGSVGNRPFVPGLPIGTVTAVDHQHAGLAATATVRPAVDPATLDLVGVLLSAPRDAPRAPATGSAG